MKLSYTEMSYLTRRKHVNDGDRDGNWALYVEEGSMLKEIHKASQRQTNRGEENKFFEKRN